MKTQFITEAATGAKELLLKLYPDMEGQCAGAEGLRRMSQYSPASLSMDSGDSHAIFLHKHRARVSAPFQAFVRTKKHSPPPSPPTPGPDSPGCSGFLS